MSQTYVRSDDIKISTLLLSNYDGSKNYDMSAQCIAFNIYEDIMFPVTRADFIIVDSVNILMGFPIIGEEYITAEFANPGIDITTSYTFQIKNVAQQHVVPGAKTRTYVLKCVSEEFITSAQQFVTTPYSGNTDDIIRDVCQKYLQTQKSINIVDPTKGSHNNLVSRIRPLQLIDFYRKRAVSQLYKSSSYVFFENKRGFNFCTIEYLQDQLQNNVNDKIFFYDTAQLSDAKNMNSRSIISMQQIGQNDNTTKLAQGALHNQVKRFDLFTGKVATTIYKNLEQQSNFKFATDKPTGLNTTTFENDYGSNPAKSLLLPHSSHLPENFIDSVLGFKHSYISKLSQNIFRAYVFGDVGLTAGDIITVNVPSPVGSTSGSTDDVDNRLYAGNFLVSKVRHIVNNSSPNPKTYYVALELIKGFYQDYA
jgi:hypothetical protein